jgi:hypothetical protein
MVKVTKRGAVYEGGGVIVEGVVETEDDLTTDLECLACAPGSKFEADDWSFVAKKKLDGTWKIVQTGL